MKLVIDIDDKTYRTIKDGLFLIKGGRGSGRAIEYNALKAIYDGKPLPKEFKNDMCDCLTKEYVPIRYEVIGYGRELNVGVSFTKQEIYTHYDYHCDSGVRKSLAIKYCPFCGRKLCKAESEE